MKKIATFALAAAAGALLATDAAAQACIGFPIPDGRGAVGAVVRFPEGGDQFGVEGAWNLNGPFALFAEGSVVSLDGSDSDATAGEIGAAYDLASVGASLGRSLGAPASACPQLSVAVTTIEDFVTVTQVPVGFGVGATFPAGATSSVSPYVVPAIVWTSYDYEGAAEEDSSTDFGLRAGGVLSFGRIYVGAEVDKVFEEGSDATFGIRGGIRI